VLRCWAPSDAPALRKALDACDAHLRPWIPFMKDEPRSLEETVTWLRSHRENFDADRLHRYAVFGRKSGELLGENMLLDRVGPGGLEVGYWTHVDAVGKGIATEASAAMVQIGFKLAGIDRIEIHCAAGNAPSAAIPARLGFTHEATLRRRAEDTEGTLHDLMIWTLFASEYPATTSAELDLRAYDCLDRRIL
ncbi:MAG: GNAT family N-acetyltransferase, partial [Xanthomonadales bacterium]|nr:GNAT family N-acetyltransferase [Xanthomonadales bacterium]